MKEFFLFLFCFSPVIAFCEGYSRIDYRFSSKTKIMPQECEVVDNHVRCSKLVFEKIRINDGDIIISTKEGGFLGRAIRVHRSFDDYYIETERTTMEEAFESLNVSYRGKLEPNDVRNIDSFYPEIKVVNRNNEKRFTINLSDFVLYDYDGDLSTKDDRIVLNGFVSFTPDVECDININQNSIKELKFIVTFDKNADFDLKLTTPIKIPLPFSKEFTLVKYEFNPIVIGPVVFTPIALVVAGVNIGITGDVIVNLKSSISVKYGMSYINGRWYEISDVRDKSFNGSLSFIGANGFLKGYIGPVFKFRFYNRIGPYIKGDGYLKANADLINLNPKTIKWELKGGLEGKVGVNVKIFSWFVKDFEKDIACYEVVIDSGEMSGVFRNIPVVYPKDYELDFVEIPLITKNASDFR